MIKIQATGKNSVYFVFVRPEFLGNIGSIARVMKNFGFSNLRLVDAPRNYKDAEARKMSVGAFDVLKEAVTFQSLADALADMHFVAGTSSGQQRDQPLKTLDEALALMPLSGQNKIAIVFGDERNGLRSDELGLCHIIVRIPTDPAFPSLNLAQSAGIIAYELSKKFNDINCSVPESDMSSLSSETETDRLFDQVEILLDNIGLARPYNKSLLLSELRRFYNRAVPTKRESDLLHATLRKLNRKVVDRNQD